MKRKPKREALNVSKLIHEVLVNQLNIPFTQIVNDSTFSEYTGSLRPDLLISEQEFSIEKNNQKQFIENLVGYAEVKDDCLFEDRDWEDAKRQGKIKSKKLKLPYFIVTNLKTTVFYNAKNGKELRLNNNPIREFQTIDILRLIKSRLEKEQNLLNINTNVDSLSAMSEAIFNKKLWELKTIYRGINFKDNSNDKIDFTIGFISLKFFEEKEKVEKSLDRTKLYWSNCTDENDSKLVGNLSEYIKRLELETDFTEFKDLMEIVRKFITSQSGKKPLIEKQDVRQIYGIIDSVGQLHGCGFDLFGAVYESFASNKQKKDFGEYFTRRHYTHIFSKLLLLNETHFNEKHKFRILDLACGTGGFLTESFKVLKNNYVKNLCFSQNAKDFLSKNCFFGVDVKEENIQRTKLNMFLVGDGHTNIFDDDSLRPKKKWAKQKYEYIITNPPYGSGTIKANTDLINTVRTEISFLCQILSLLEVQGKACVIIPDGVLENPTFSKLREGIMKKCRIDAIISLPKFAFAPYTKEKTYALFITKTSEIPTELQSSSIWMYIIDNDGLANSDKRFPTKLRNNRNGWMHDEISGWVSTKGEEMSGLLETHWLKYTDNKTGTEWINEKGEPTKLKKAMFLDTKKLNEKNYFNLLPEYWLRPYDPKFIELKELEEELKKIKKRFGEVL